MGHAGLPPATPLPSVPATPLDSAKQGEDVQLNVSLDEPIRQDAVLATLEQLYAAYKAEHGACLEELQALHGEFTGAGHAAVSDSFKAARQGDKKQQHPADASGSGGAGGAGGGEDDPAAFSDAEEEILSASAGAAGGGAAGAGGEAALEAARQRFRARARGIADLERVASASTALLMDAQGALACLCGRGGRYLVRRTAVSIGRSNDSKGDVDVDLSKEGPAGKVSRLQAQLELGSGGAWAVRNVGRRCLMVDGAPVQRGESAPLPHLGLLEVGGAQLLFMTNPLATQRALARMQQLVM